MPPTETAPSVPGGTRRKSGRRTVGVFSACPTSVPTVSMRAVAKAAAAARRSSAEEPGVSAAQATRNAATEQFARTFAAPRRPPASSAFPIASFRLRPKRVVSVPPAKKTQRSA